MSVRRAVVAGRFYASEPARLEADIAECFRRAKSAPVPTECGEYRESGAPAVAKSGAWSEDSPLLVMLPHAGHVFCGPVIAGTLAGIALPRRLVALAPGHTGPEHPPACWPEGTWEIPSGDVPVDAALGRELIALDDGFIPYEKAHVQEHAIEVLLPFLRTVRPDMSILPIVVNQQDALVQAGSALAKLIAAHEMDGEDRVALILSSDMNHYASDKETRRLDRLALQAFLALDAQKLAEVVLRNRISMCGILPAMISLLAVRDLGATHARLMAYDTSGTASGNTDRVVGYAGVRVW